MTAQVLPSSYLLIRHLMDLGKFCVCRHFRESAACSISSSLVTVPFVNTLWPLSGSLGVPVAVPALGGHRGLAG